MSDYVFIPHTYKIRWAMELTRFLMGKMKTPKNAKPELYLKSRSTQLNLQAELMKWLRVNENKKLFFANVHDFNPGFVNHGWAERIVGISHDTTHYPEKIGDMKTGKRERDYENARAQYFDVNFSVARSMQNLVPYNVEYVGLPNFWKIRKPNSGRYFIFNSRLLERKGADKLFDLPRSIVDRLLIASPTINPRLHKKILDELKPAGLFINPGNYPDLLKQARVVLILSDFEMFGCAAADAIANGAIPVSLKKEFNFTSDWILPELQTKNLNEFSEKALEIFDSPKRQSLLEEQQLFLHELEPEKWWGKVEEFLI